MMIKTLLFPFSEAGGFWVKFVGEGLRALP